VIREQTKLYKAFCEAADLDPDRAVEFLESKHSELGVRSINEWLEIVNKYSTASAIFGDAVAGALFPQIKGPFDIEETDTVLINIMQEYVDLIKKEIEDES